MSDHVLRIAILGATSEVAKDLIEAFLNKSPHHLTLFGRRPEAILDWISGRALSGQYSVMHLDEFYATQKFDVLINFIGIGNPALAALMDTSILEITNKYDGLAIAYLSKNPCCRYIFLSSGAVYGLNFSEPPTENSLSIIPINQIQSQNWYSIAKLYAECRHRALPELGIVDVRLFNYFSHTQDMNARYLMTDICRAISNGSILITSPNEMMRDFISPSDFFNLITRIISAQKSNLAVDCYSLKPLEKSQLLSEMRLKFDLKYEVRQTDSHVNATGEKKFYFSKNNKAAIFGYKPQKTSLDSVIEEVNLYLKSIAKVQSRIVD